ALRILSLLEDHHRKLAGLIKEAPRNKDRRGSSTSEAPESPAAPSQPRTSTNRTSSSSSSSSTTSSPTPPTSRRRLPQSSIASNLAEKRGIPSARRTAGSTPLNVAGAIAARTEQPSTPVRDLLAQQSRKAELSKSRDSPTQRDAPQPVSPPAEDNFRRFYSAFGGVISAISAPLAFTSLPLNPSAPTPVPEPPQEETPSKVKPRAPSPEASRTVKSSVPDLAALISKPALRALREDGAPPLGPNESFYLVPTSGGTVTYASILRDPNAPNATSQDSRLNTINEGSDSLKGSSHEEFVDARENVGPPSPTKARRPHSRENSSAGLTAQRSIPAGRGAGLKTMEELALENETLKALVDKQAKRIQMWETNSQNSFNALAQSFRARGPGRTGSDPSALALALAQGSNAVPALPSPPLPGQHLPPSPGVDPQTAKRIAELEALLANQTAKVNDLMTNNEQLAKQNERNAQVLGRYREQWEKLKAGARKKEQERRERRLVQVKAGETGKDSESGDGTTADGDENLEGEEADFGKA
ncbi:Nn.00g040860.m01.CDS01, partial [Neocucurbitaria sp. VM-36]